MFESAYFNPLSVRRTSKALGLKTEASMRFERGTDPRSAGRRWSARARCSSHRRRRARGTVVDRYPARDRADVVCGCGAHASPGCSACRFRTPTCAASSRAWASRCGRRRWMGRHRPDAAGRREREVDLIEEVARHYGFDRIPATFPALTRTAAAGWTRASRRPGSCAR